MPATNELLQEGRYRIGQRSTGNDNVYEAYDTVRNTNVVVREIPVKLNKVMTVSQQESLKLAFTNQAKALTEIDHTALLHVHDFFSEIDRQYLVMEVIEGEDLGSMVARNKKAFSVAEVTRWADQLLDALHCLHTHRPTIVHRNIRPQNVKLDSSGKIKLLGIAVETAGEATATDDATELRYSPIEQIWPGLDAASQKAITNSYDDRSERILKEPLDARSDIYSLGATLYFLITGCEPVDPLERSIDLLEGKLDPLREPSKVDSQIPPEISDVLMKALEIKRENRYDSAMIMRHVLTDALARVDEREEDDAREQREASEIIRMAEKAKSEEAVEAAAAEERRLAAEAEQQKALAEQAEAERVARQRQEEQAAQAKAEAEEAARAQAEAERAAIAKAEADAKAKAEADAKAKAEADAKAKAEADAKAQAEADAKAKTKAEAEEAAKVAALASESKNAVNASVDSLREGPVSAEVVAYRESPSIDEDELAAVLEELEEVEAASAKAEHEVTEVEIKNDDVQVIDHAVDMAPPPVSYTSVDDDEEIFSVPEKAGSSLPMPAIAGAIGLVVVLAIGGWFMMSGSSNNAPPAPAPSVQVSQPPASEVNPAAETATSTEAPTDSVPVTTEVSTEQPVAAVKTAATPKAKKPDAKADAAKKKAVTVDDLINDN